jgi:hypothetical protein
LLKSTHIPGLLRRLVSVLFWHSARVMTGIPCHTDYLPGASS